MRNSGFGADSLREKQRYHLSCAPLRWLATPPRPFETKWHAPETHLQLSESLIQRFETNLRSPETPLHSFQSPLQSSETLLRLFEARLQPPEAFLQTFEALLRSSEAFLQTPDSSTNSRRV